MKRLIFKNNAFLINANDEEQGAGFDFAVLEITEDFKAELRLAMHRAEIERMEDFGIYHNSEKPLKPAFITKGNIYYDTNYNRVAYYTRKDIGKIIDLREFDEAGSTVLFEGEIPAEVLYEERFTRDVHIEVRSDEFRLHGVCAEKIETLVSDWVSAIDRNLNLYDNYIISNKEEEMSSTEQLLNEVAEKLELDCIMSVNELVEYFGKEDLSTLAEHLGDEAFLGMLLEANFSDGEDITEQPEVFLEEIKEALDKRGVYIDSIKTNRNDEERDSFILTIGYEINGSELQHKTLTVWTNEEAKTIHNWSLAVSRMLNLVNSLLYEAQSRDRMVMIDGWIQVFVQRALTTARAYNKFHYELASSALIKKRLQK